MSVFWAFLSILICLLLEEVCSMSVERCDGLVSSVVGAADAVFTAKVQALNGSRGTDREAVVLVKRVFRKPTLPEDNDAHDQSGWVWDLAPGRKSRLAISPVNSSLNEDFLACFGLFYPMFTLRVGDTKMFLVKLDALGKHGLAVNRDNFPPRVRLLTCPLPMTLANLRRISLAIQGKAWTTCQGCSRIINRDYTNVTPL